MTDLNKEREAFEKLSEIAEILNEEKSHFNGDFYDLPFNSCAESFINGAWYAWQEKAKAQAVPDGYVLIKKEDIENWYLDESEYMWFEADGIDGYLEDIDIGEVVEVQRKEYVVTNSNPVFAAKPWDDKRYCADTWEFFESKDEAEKAAAHCKAMFEASESGAEG